MKIPAFYLHSSTQFLGILLINEWRIKLTFGTEESLCAIFVHANKTFGTAIVVGKRDIGIQFVLKMSCRSLYDSRFQALS